MFDNLCPEDTMVLANAIALSLYPGKTADELNVLGNLIVAVGSLLLTAAAQKQALSSQQTNAGASMDCTPSDNAASDNMSSDNSFNGNSTENSTESSTDNSTENSTKDASTKET
ncbi:hypothetical protein SAMN02745136_00091 [Anaerocolumna jejuensis DSM 15929]|uniref:Uncharacterized protein n=1 Tax=Anaerocolumna jejuensis DSM 15929 TaxID=1121322 RepID=A0A1M6JI68_9FIRM|nr:hypothetical protein [Anaerocolumna jejuensis]SHJ46399.1 hypothetical protein SAMN02745136_00091 [Anaerocolumna jejuensis DSM 15929]